MATSGEGDESKRDASLVQTSPPPPVAFVGDEQVAELANGLRPAVWGKFNKCQSVVCVSVSCVSPACVGQMQSSCAPPCVFVVRIGQPGLVLNILSPPTDPGFTVRTQSPHTHHVPREVRCSQLNHELNQTQSDSIRMMQSDCVWPPSRGCTTTFEAARSVHVPSLCATRHSRYNRQLQHLQVPNPRGATQGVHGLESGVAGRIYS